MLYTSKEQIPLKAYAEMMRSGILQLVSGSPKDIPTVTDVSYFRCGLTGWAPKGVLVASEELFKSEFAERRLLPIFTRPVAVSTVAARAADLEKPGTDRRAPPGGEGARGRRQVVLLPDPVVGRHDPLLPVQDRDAEVSRRPSCSTRRHDALSVVALSTIPPMLSTITTMSQSGRL